MRVLVTRPVEDAVETARLLEAMGHQAIIAPLFKIRFYDGTRISTDGVQAVLATSANGVRAFARRTDERAIPVLAVGPQTAQMAKAAGFADVKSADGDAAALAAAVAQWAAPQSGVLLHAAGKESEGKLEADLGRRGFSVRRETLYEAVAATELPAEAMETLNGSSLDAVLFFSPRSAAVFCRCVNPLKLNEKLRKIVACCISANTANALALSFQEVRVAASPNQTALLACLGGNSV